MSNFLVRKAAVLGAGVMGAQIAAHLVNVKVPVVLFDLPAKEGPKNGIVLKAIDNRHQQPFRYLESGNPFEYELVRYFYRQKRELEVMK